ncbi:hypothetical protein MX773_000142 [Vibrio parahaemolyticus]|nr:hypothetical protein [Vibrio parahaemolyticus]EJC7053614.1 hypothetical protein [Vibrio parahaemolyticus]EJD3757526.1 hypothetical protein [Vibrio parahaemolyticus]EJF4109013.1 hypothetical protein [Vibrio parahaemolyticus]
MFRKITLLLISASMLTGCLPEQPTDEDCIDTDADLSEITSKSFSEHFTICKSLDKNVQLNNVFDDMADQEENIFSSNQFITEADAARKNAEQAVIQETGDLVFELNNDLVDFFKSHGGLVTYTILGMLLSGLYALKRYNSEQHSIIDIVAKSVAIFALIMFFGLVVSQSQWFQKGWSRVTMLTGNGFIKNFEAKQINNVTSIKRKVTADFNNQAQIQIESLFKANICLSNNRKEMLHHKELTLNGYGDVSKLVSFYKGKNEPYFPRTEPRNERVIKYHYNNLSQYPTISGIELKGCGFLPIKSTKFSGELAEIMRSVDFSNALFDAIVSNNFESGWTKISDKFDELNPVSDQMAKNRKTQLLVAYKKEFIKGLIAGAVLFDEKTGEPIKTDFSNFNKLMQQADEYYRYINKSVCIVNNEILIETNKRLPEFMQTGEMTYYYCMDLNKEKPTLVTKNLYIPESGSVQHKSSKRVEKLNDVEREVKKARNFFKASRQELADSYSNVQDAYSEELDKIYNINQTLIEYYNCGSRCVQKFWKTVYHDNPELRHLYSVSGFFFKFDYSKSLPYFNSSVDQQVDNYAKIYNVDFVEQFIPKDDVNLKLIQAFEEMNGTIGTEMLKNQWHVESSVENTVKGDSWLDGVESTIKNQERLYCIGLPENGSAKTECRDYMVSGGGVSTYYDIQSQYLDYGSDLAIGGLTTKYVASNAAAFAESKLNSYIAKEKKSQKSFATGSKKSSKKGAAIAAQSSMIAAQAAAFSGSVMVVFGATVYIVGLLMSMPDMFINGMILISDLSSALTLRLLPILIITATVMFFLFGRDRKSIFDYGFYIYRLVLTPVLLKIISFIVIPLSLYTNDMIKNYAAATIDTTTFDNMLIADSAFAFGLNFILVGIRSVFLFASIIVMIYFSLKLPGWIALAADRLDQVTLFKTRTDDAFEQNNFTKNAIAIAGMKYSKQIAGFDKNEKNLRERRKVAKRGIKPKRDMNSNVGVDKKE